MVLLVVLAACSGGSTEPDVSAAAPEERDPAADEAPPDEPVAAEEPDPAGAAEEPSAPEELPGNLVATSVVDDIEVFADPTEDAERTHTLAHPTDRGAPRVFLVEQLQDDWIEVLLPVRPNGSVGWIRADDVTLASNPYDVEVDLAAFELTIERAGELVLTADIGFGADDTPTPGGRYYLIELLQPPDPNGLYGPFAYGLSGFSDVHLDFAGGEGVIGIHGTNQPDSIGRSVSNGCIRVHNDVITEMAEFLPLGTPVTIS
ncbi:MAG: L,D-transpeptidase family protein [Nitriliruptoraceae bacterium]|nr:L,D-transpeptidase family protein [Nitriliruptoraceae bacterium]